MNYMLLVYLDETSPEKPTGCDGLGERLHKEGKLIASGILKPIASATSVKVREGRRVITDGPFAETREQLAGFLMVDAKDLDEAIAIASEHPVVKMGTIEVRPLFEVSH